MASTQPQTPPTAESDHSPPEESSSPSSLPQQYQGRGHRGQGRGGRGRGRSIPAGGRAGHGMRGPPHQGRGDGPVGIAPTSGVPYGHVPAYLPGSSSLVEDLDERVLIVLRDGRHLVGILRSFDQFSNMVLEDASERKVHREPDGVTYFADIPLGVYIVRGDSMVLFGQVSPDDGMTKVEIDKLEAMSKKAANHELEWDFDKDLLA